MQKLGSGASSLASADGNAWTASTEVAAPCGGMYLALGDSRELGDRYARVRQQTEALAGPLSAEDMVVQSMPDASPAKWHLAHTTWFFETMVLSVHLPRYCGFDPGYGYLFNSYYEAFGPRQPRAQRGLLTRPSAPDIMAYRRYVDGHMRTLLRYGVSAEIEDLVRLGLAHEEQHQELLLMDVLDLFSRSPIKPAYDKDWPVDAVGRKGRYRGMSGGPFELGVAAARFAFDNERPRHTTWLRPFEICDRLVTNGEWLSFMANGGYSRPELWLSDGWTLVQSESWDSPRYWVQTPDGWSLMTLGGLRKVGCSGHTRQLLRGCRVRCVGRRTFGYRGGMGVRRARRSARTARGCGLAMDAEHIRCLSRLSTGGESGGRIQRQIHGRADGLARWSKCHAGPSFAPDVSQFLPPRTALDVFGHPSRARPDPVKRVGRADASGFRFRGGRCRRPAGERKDASPKVLLRCGWLGAVRGHHPDARILSDTR